MSGTTVDTVTQIGAMIDLSPYSGSRSGSGWTASVNGLERDGRRNHSPTSRSNLFDSVETFRFATLGLTSSLLLRQKTRSVLSSRGEESLARRALRCTVLVVGTVI